MLHNPERYLGKPYLAIVQTSGEILAVAIRTPPQKLILSKAQNMDALRLIAQDLRQEQLLDQGCRHCFLIADLANPTANHIYQAIGYRPLSDWHEYSFTSKH
ncbi:hypothetical protein NIES37_70320 (plasmid) [Tolypothrix tenuis PCC 7101]|uniref:N-acetyltransferase domain-containing protein n=1 Tax=Tolypothrix tenuis PCC 7101 TaxID=231146 RepID=A0A1Z4NBB5_9CYAN|nr:hypothetical protein NIES2107_74350 [Nostoc carneum NIES-2107]BAZ03019.1 hypothetical protein NIES37_70320 [Tolypothrix tenuis PCC 7101]BAZ78057.1 hypothetical protein NIES50_66900 [Aulosira laxa NIES-50]